MHYSGLIHTFSSISDHISTIVVAGGYPFLFLTVILEGVPLLGTIVPGHIAILAAGFLVKVGVMNIWVVLILTLSAAITGDFIGFSIGRKYGLTFIDKYKKYFFLNDNHIKKAQDLMIRHSGKAMILGRLSPVTRALMPFIVGSSKTSQTKFWVFNIIGAIIWVLSSLTLGYIFGFGYHAAAGYFGRFVVISVIFAVFMLWSYRFINLRFKIFRKYELFVLILNIVSFWILAKMIQDAWSTQSFMAYFDVVVNNFVTSLLEITPPILTSLTTFVTNVGGTEMMILLGAIFTAILVHNKRWRSAVIMFLSVLSSTILVLWMKDFFMRPRPDNSFALNEIGYWSFPSGHATLAAAFFTALIYIYSPKIKYWVKREIFIVLCVLAVILVGLSRIILNVHWASDVIAGWSLGVFCTTASILLVRYVGEFFRKK